MMPVTPLTLDSLERILARLPSLAVGVVGDLFLDRYLDIDGDLTEPSLETGLDAYQVTQVRSIPGAAGTVINNLVALGVGQVFPISVIGNDGEGYELMQALDKLGVSRQWVHLEKSRRTPTYTKPMLREHGKPPRELNRLDIQNRAPLPREAEEAILTSLAELGPRFDARIVSDQVSEPECGVITTPVREHLARMGTAKPEAVILADSRERIGLFRSVWLKPNQKECRGAILGKKENAASRERQRPEQGPQEDAAACTRKLARRAGRPVFCTRGADGILVIDPRQNPCLEESVPAYEVSGPIDAVGAGDSVNAALACALGSGASLVEAAAFANLVASITIRQIGATGTATPEQVRAAWRA